MVVLALYLVLCFACGVQAEAAQKLVSKINPGLGNKYEKAKMLKEIEGAKNVELAPVTGISYLVLL